MSPYQHIVILAFPLLLATVSPSVAQEMPSEVPQEALARLDERIGLLKNEFPTLPLTTLLGGTPRTQIVALIAIDARKAMTTIENVHRKLDRAAFAGIKRNIYTVGATIEKNRTTRSTMQRRREMLLEFASIVKRQGLLLTTYYPAGTAKFAMIQGDSDETLKEIDERYQTVSTRVKAEVEQQQAAGGGTAGGSSGGSSDGWGIGEGETTDEPARPSGARDDDLGATRSGGRALRGRGSDWSAIFFTGIVLIIVGSSLVLLLPKFVSYGRAFFRAGFTRRMQTVAEDPFKLGLTQFQRGKLDKALEYFQRVAAEPGERMVNGLYYSALCLVKLGQKNRAVREIATLPLATLSNEEVYRLGRACDEAGCQDSAATLYREVFTRDPSYKDVKQRLPKDASRPPGAPPEG